MSAVQDSAHKVYLISGEVVEQRKSVMDIQKSQGNELAELCGKGSIELGQVSAHKVYLISGEVVEEKKKGVGWWWVVVKLTNTLMR